MAGGYGWGSARKGALTDGELGGSRMHGAGTVAAGDAGVLVEAFKGR